MTSSFSSIFVFLINPTIILYFRSILFSFCFFQLARALLFPLTICFSVNSVWFCSFPRFFHVRHSIPCLFIIHSYVLRILAINCYTWIYFILMAFAKVISRHNRNYSYYMYMKMFVKFLREISIKRKGHGATKRKCEMDRDWKGIVKGSCLQLRG